MKKLISFLMALVVLVPSLVTPSYAGSVPPVTVQRALDLTRLSDTDVGIVGCGEAGFAAAIGAARQGKTVKLFCERDRVGGTTGGGISQTDVVTTKPDSLVVGFAKEFYTELANAETVDYTFHQWHRNNAVGRPSYYQREINKMLGRYPGIQVYYNRSLASVEKSGTVIKALNFQNSSCATNCTIERFTVKRAIDGSYTGDLQQKMGLTVSIGRESTTYASESLAGVQSPGAWTNSQNVDPYVTAGVPGSGLLFGISPSPNTTVGAGDGLPMEFGYRMFFTSISGEKIAFPAPTNYDATKYELLGREMAQDPTYFGNTTLGLTRLFQFYDLSPSGGTAMGPTFMTIVDINSLGAVSTNYPNAAETREYITASPARRRVIESNAWQWVLGLIQFINTDGRVPATLKTALNSYGFSNREWQAYGGAPPEFYVREGARIVGDGSPFSQAQVQSFVNSQVNPIARVYYDIDSHNVQRLVVGGYARIEGASLVSLGLEVGAPIPYTVLLPKAAESTTTLHPANPYVTQVAWRSIRMAPIELSMGYAAGVASSLSIDCNCSVQSIDVVRLNRIIDIDEVWKGITVSADMTDGTSGVGTFTRGVVTTSGSGTMTQAANRAFFIGQYAATWPSGSTVKKKIQPKLYTSGLYNVRLMYPSSSTGPTNATINLSCGGTVSTRTITQQYPGGGGGFWEDMGSCYMRAGPSTADPTSPDYVELDTTGADGTFRYGGVQFIPVKP